ncbi:MAG: hypothetical protein HY980_03350 [Candidatus Magasanikbacteria bacterium]|nr:hypothetical protein [Candidatus Magasanikbacteria bacterium]
MKLSILKGVSFGLTSGTITTLGLMVGLQSSTGLKSIVAGGILTIAIADALSDALGIHISEESENLHSVKEIWESTIATFLAKFIYASTFLIPIYFFALSPAIVINIIYGLLVLGLISYWMAKEQKQKPTRIIAEHLLIAVVVIAITHLVGDWVSVLFG